MTTSEPCADKGPRRIPELDALRGLAALAVTLYHFTWFIASELIAPGTPLPFIQISWGCYGVQLFFAISGFVILKTLDTTSTARRFVLARFWRLFPSYWLAMIITFAIVTILGPEQLRVSWTVFALNVPMLQLFTRVPMVDGAYWSLNVELAFYLCMLFLWRVNLTRRIELVLVPWIGLKWLWWAVPSLPYPLGLLLIADYVPYFAIGILSYRVWAGQRRWFEQLPILALVSGTVLVIDPTDARWIIAVLVPGFLLLAAGRVAWLAHPALVWLGAISYPLYLIHSFIGFSVILRLEAMGLSPDVATLIALALVLSLAAAMTKWVEKFGARRRVYARMSPA
ncbi:MAG: acyltransferase [Sphingomonas sp.]